MPVVQKPLCPQRRSVEMTSNGGRGGVYPLTAKQGRLRASPDIRRQKARDRVVDLPPTNP